MTEDINFNTRKQKSFDYTSETAKQLITLAAGIIAFTVTFTKDIFINKDVDISNFGKWMLILSWTYYFISIVAGLSTIMTLTGQLLEEDNPDTMATPVRLCGILQQLTFVFGSLYAGLFGAAMLSVTPLFQGAAYFYVCLAISIILPLGVILFAVIKIISAKKPQEDIIFDAYIKKDNFEIVRKVDLEASNIELTMSPLATKPNLTSHLKVNVSYLPEDG
jgi:hypothetical protein